MADREGRPRAIDPERGKFNLRLTLRIDEALSRLLDQATSQNVLGLSQSQIIRAGVREACIRLIKEAKDGAVPEQDFSKGVRNKYGAKGGGRA